MHLDFEEVRAEAIRYKGVRGGLRAALRADWNSPVPIFECLRPLLISEGYKRRSLSRRRCRDLPLVVPDLSLVLQDLGIRGFLPAQPAFQGCLRLRELL